MTSTRVEGVQARAWERMYSCSASARVRHCTPVTTSSVPWKDFWDQAHHGLQAAFAARQGVDIRVKSALDAGGFKQAFLDAHDFRDQHGRVVLPLGRIADREGGRNPDRQAVADRTSQAGGERLAHRFGVGLALRIRLRGCGALALGVGDRIADRPGFTPGLRIRNASPNCFW